MIVSRTPFRVSLFGGGTDFKFWIKKYGSNIISFSIDKYCYLTVRKLPAFFNHRHRFVYSKTELVNNFNDIEHPSIKETLKYYNIKDGLEIIHYGDLPARSGLGSSSSFTVGLINSLNTLYNLKMTKKIISENAILIEQKKIKENVGYQDQIAVSYGGFNQIKFNKYCNFTVNKINISKSKIDDFHNSSMLVYSGVDRDSNNIQKKVFNKKINKELLKKLHDISIEANKYTKNNRFDIEAIGNLVNESWEYKKRLSPIISSPHLEKVIKIATDVGIYGKKVIGAGGGGFVLLIFPKKNKIELQKALKKYITVPIKIDSSGTKILKSDFR